MMNNTGSNGKSGLETLEPPEQAARVAGQPAPAPTPPAQTTTPGRTYQVPPSQTPAQYPQPQYTQPQTPQAQQGVNPVLVTLLVVLGGIIVLGIVVVLTVMFAAGNIIRQISTAEVGELRVTNQSVQLGEAKSVTVDLQFGVGSLSVAGGGTELMDATFTYNVEAWKPSVQYNVLGDQGSLSVQQPKSNTITTSPNVRNEWKLLFKGGVPMTMKVNTGVGTSTLNFEGLDLGRLEVNTGVGDTTIDLNGTWARDLNVLVNGGVGNLKIMLPSGTGVKVIANSGLGKVRATGLTVSGDTYTNSAYGKSPTTINIVVESGLGDVELIGAK